MFVCFVVFVLYASRYIKTDRMEVGACGGRGGGIDQPVSSSHSCLVGKQSTNRQSRAGNPSWEPSSSLTSGVSAEGDLFQRDTPSVANLKRAPLSKQGNTQGHIFLNEHTQHLLCTHPPAFFQKGRLSLVNHEMCMRDMVMVYFPQKYLYDIVLFICLILMCLLYIPSQQLNGVNR